MILNSATKQASELAAQLPLLTILIIDTMRPTEQASKLGVSIQLDFRRSRSRSKIAILNK